jgi:hypothetical protein
MLFIATMIVIVYAMKIIIFVILYNFHDHSHGWMITITKYHMIMVVEFCNIKFNSSRGTHPTIEIQILKYKLNFLKLIFFFHVVFRLNSRIYCPLMSCQMATYFKFKKILSSYGLLCDNLKLGYEHFLPNHVMSHDNQGLKSLV